MATKNTIRLQPISGKFAMVTINGRTVRIWLVDPDTNEQGTAIAYSDAVTLLKQRHPVVTLAKIKDKDGKYVQQLTAEELAEIKASHDTDENVTPQLEVKDDQEKKRLEKLVEQQAKELEELKKKVAKKEGKKGGIFGGKDAEK